MGWAEWETLDKTCAATYTHTCPAGNQFLPPHCGSPLPHTNLCSWERKLCIRANGKLLGLMKALPVQSMNASNPRHLLLAVERACRLYLNVNVASPVQWQCFLQPQPPVWPPLNSPHSPTAVSHPLVPITHSTTLQQSCCEVRVARAKRCSDIQ